MSGLAKSVYYYTLSKIDKDDKNKEIIDKIKEIFINNKERYGYRRITLELRNQGYNVNHKKVYRLMVKLGLKPLKRNKRKYSSYKGTIGKIADNLIERDFNAEKPNQKWYTDVTEFNLRGEKCYLSPILDGYNGEIISYNRNCVVFFKVMISFRCRIWLYTLLGMRYDEVNKSKFVERSK